MVIKKKAFLCRKEEVCNVVLKREGTHYIVEVDGTVYKNTPNELFAVQTFNEI